MELYLIPVVIVAIFLIDYFLDWYERYTLRKHIERLIIEISQTDRELSGLQKAAKQATDAFNDFAKAIDNSSLNKDNNE